MSGKSLFGVWRVFALCIFCWMPAVWAHHASTGFDRDKRIIFRGEVRKFAWVNPHAFLYVDVQKASGKKELWGFATGGPSYLNRTGWKITDFPPGAKVTVYAYGPRRNGQPIALMSKVVLADGREFKNFDSGSVPPPTAGQASGSSVVKKQSEYVYVEYK